MESVPFLVVGVLGDIGIMSCGAAETEWDGNAVACRLVVEYRVRLYGRPPEIIKLGFLGSWLCPCPGCSLWLTIILLDSDYMPQNIVLSINYV